MKIFCLTLSVLFFTQTIFAQRDTLIVNGVKFLTVRHTMMNGLGTQDTLIKMYRIEKGKLKYLLKHYLYSYDGDCNNLFTDIGTVEVHHDSIIFKTHTIQKRHDPIAEWVKQIYKVRSDGKLILVYNKEYRNEKWVNPR